MKEIIYKYVFITIMVFILINIIVYFYTISQESAIGIYLNSIFFTGWISYAFGLICSLFILADRKKLTLSSIGSGLFALIFIITILDYFTGIVLFLFLVIADEKYSD